MSTVVRLKRTGSKKRPFYHLVVTDSRSPRDSNFIEKLGTYNPKIKDESALTLNKERAVDWIKKGAQLSAKTKLLFSQVGVNK